MNKLVPALLPLALLTGCGGSDDDGTTLPQNGFAFSQASNYSGDSGTLTATGTYAPSGANTIATFAVGNRSLVVTLPTAAICDPGEVCSAALTNFGDGANEARANYGESGVVGTFAWKSETVGGLAASRTGTTLRLALSGVRFTAAPAGAANPTGTFVLSGTRDSNPGAIPTRRTSQ